MGPEPVKLRTTSTPAHRARLSGSPIPKGTTIKPKALGRLNLGSGGIARLVQIGAATFALIGLGLLFALRAATASADGPSLSLSPSSGQTGTSIKASVTGFQRGQTVSITDQTVGVGTLCTINPNGGGSGNCQFTISSAEATTGGSQTLRADDGRNSATAGLNVTANMPTPAPDTATPTRTTASTSTSTPVATATSATASTATRTPTVSQTPVATATTASTATASPTGARGQTAALTPTAGQAGTLVTIGWTHLLHTTATVTDLTVAVGTLCTGPSNGAGDGSCQFTISSAEAAIGGTHTIQVTDGTNSATTGLAITADTPTVTPSPTDTTAAGATATATPTLSPTSAATSTASPTGARGQTLTLAPTSGQSGTVITATWSHLLHTTGTVTDLTVDVGTLCFGPSNGGGNGSCTFTISSAEAATGGSHTIQVSDGTNSATAGLTVTANTPTVTPTMTITQTPSITPTSTPTAVVAPPATLSVSPNSGSATTVVTATWANFAASTSVNITDQTVPGLGTLCSAVSSASGGGNCTWTITTNEAATGGNHLIQASDGTHTATFSENITGSVDGLGTSGLVVLTLVLVGLGLWRLRNDPTFNPEPRRPLSWPWQRRHQSLD